MIIVQHTPEPYAQELRQNFAFAVNRIKRDGFMPGETGLDSEVESALLRWMIDGEMASYELAEAALNAQIAGENDGA